MSTGSQPPEPAEPGVQLSETGVWLSQDGAWEWDGANWVPRVADVVWLGRLIGFSNRDLDANRAGRLTFGQAAGLWLWALIWSGLGILLVGIALASTLPESIWVRVFVGPIVFTIAVYFCWRGFAAAVDAVSGAVAVTSGTLYKRWDSDDDAPWQGAGYYYVGVGGVERKLYKSAGERVPVGIYCRAYYAYGSNRLLSVEPAASVDEYAFDPTGKTWARVRRGGVTAIVGIFCLVVGSGYVVAGDPNRRIDSTVAGVLLLLVGGILLSAIAWRILRKGRGGQTS
jgi:hypothetical protein